VSGGDRLSPVCRRPGALPAAASAAVRSNREIRSFVAHDGAGNPYRVVAMRVLGLVAGQDRPGPWAFQTADGRWVRPAPVFHRYTVEPDHIPLTTSDPEEPSD